MDKKQLSIIIISLFWGIIPNAKSQNTFLVTLKDTLNDNLVWDAVQMHDGNYLLADINYTPFTSVRIMKLNPNGEIIHSKNFTYNGDTCGLSNILRINPEKYLLSGWVRESGRYKLWLYEIDSYLNEIKSRVYSLGQFNYYNNKMLMDSNNDLLCNGTVSDTTNYGITYSFIYKFSLELDSLSLKIYNEHWSLGQDLLEDNSLNRYYFFVFGYEFGSGNILLLDSTLNLIKVTEIPHDVSNFNIARWINTMNFIVTGEKRPTNPNEEHDINVLIADTSISTIHYTYFGKTDTSSWPGFNRNMDFIDVNSIFVGGTSNFYQYEFTQVDSWYFLNNFDTTLHSNWLKFFGGDGYYILYGVVATMDGGCLMFGSIWDYHNMQSYIRYPVIIKVDRDGILYTEDGKPSDKIKEVILYPNPGNDRIFIRTALRDLTLSFFDATGKCMFQKQVFPPIESVNAISFPPGIYFYRFTKNEKLIDAGKWIKQ